MKKFGFIAAIALSVAALSGCGGGGTSSDAGGTASGLYSMSVSIDDNTLAAGQSASLTARAIMRGTTPASMNWFATPLGAANSAEPGPQFGDVNCASATYSPPVISTSSGEGACRTVLTIPATTKSGVWRITNTAKAGDGATVSNFVDITITALPEGGFRILESSTPVTGYVNKALVLNAPFTVNPGTTVSNVRYAWTAAGENPALVAISGSKNSSATVVPILAGQYRFDVKVNADINGFPQEANGSVVAIVHPATFVDILDAGLPQFRQPRTTVSLTGAILNRDDSLVYVSSWRQLDGDEGGPVRIDLANANSNVASFIAPDTLGTYRFEYRVIKRQPDGSEALSTARTSVVIQAASIPAFTVSAGAAQTGTIGAPVTLTSSVGNQSGTGTTYAYQWTQLSGPAVSLSNANTTTASFIPTISGAYTFRVSVTATASNGTSTVFADTQVSIASTGTPGSNNFAMSATAGAAQSVATNAVVTLSGAQTSQGATNGVVYSYAWTQTSGTAITLANASAATASFVATTPGTFGFRLTVTATLADGTTRTATADTQVIVGTSTANTFTVTAGNAQTVANNAAVTMTGSVTTQGSFAGVTFTYQWEQVGATPAVVATISNANSLTASFLPSVPGTYTFRLTVTSNNGGTVTTREATTQVLVTP